MRVGAARLARAAASFLTSRAGACRTVTRSCRRSTAGAGSVDASRRASWRGSKLQVVRLRLQVLRLRLRRRSGSGSGGEMSRPGPAALLTLKCRMAVSASDNSVPGLRSGSSTAALCCSASLLSQRPTHSARRPSRARPRGPSGRLPPAVSENPNRNQPHLSPTTVGGCVQP